MNNFFQAWLDRGQEELSLPDMRKLYVLCMEDISHSSVTFEEELHNWQRQGWLAQKEEKFHLTVDGVKQAMHPSSPVPKDRIIQSMNTVRDVVEGWNEVAQMENLPTIACVLVYGSVARAPDQDEFGDVDCAIVWRRGASPSPATKPSPLARMKSASLLASLPPSPSLWDVEDTVEDALSGIPHVSLSSVDQLEVLSQYPQFAVARLYEDAWMGEKNMQGIRQEEQDVLQYLVPFERPLDVYQRRPSPCL